LYGCFIWRLILSVRIEEEDEEEEDDDVEVRFRDSLISKVKHFPIFVSAISAVGCRFDILLIRLLERRARRSFFQSLPEARAFRYEEKAGERWRS
jgi:hypothetical protein